MLRRVALLAMVGSCLMTPRLLGGPARPCNSSSECLSAQECYFPPVQACGGVREGYCVAELPPCDAGSGLVCGCDGDTYVSVCDAEGITDLAHFGACQIGDSCGGQTCTGNNFCQLPFGECNRYAPDGCTDGPAALQEEQYETVGQCVPYPTTCSQVDDPVCACGDGSFLLIGRTYPNACLATQDFKSIAHAGACGRGYCGGFGGFACTEPGDVCVENCQTCGFDISGRCEPETTACPDYCAPVCDCGGTWYKNRCEWKLGFQGIGYPITLGRPAGCDEMYGVKFMNKTDIIVFGSGPYNVYRATLGASGQPGAWNCVDSGIDWWPYSTTGTPAAGEVWAIGLTQVVDGVEGSLGWGGAGCTERTIANPCPP